MSDVTTFYSALIVIAVVGGILFFILLLLRELACWYFKINERMALDREILASLQALSVRLAPPPARANQPAVMSRLAENDLVNKIHDAYKSEKLAACKNYCQELVTRFPKSDYVDFAKKRIAALSLLQKSALPI